MENVYIKIYKGSRGFIEDVEVVESYLDFEDFCNDLYYSEVDKMRKECSNDEELEDLESMLEEFGYVSRIGNYYYYEVCFSEEDSYEVYKVDVNVDSWQVIIKIIMKQFENVYFNYS